MRQKLEELLNRALPVLTDKPIWIWGAGNTAQLYQEGFKRLEEEGFKIEGYIDKNADLLKNSFAGKPVILPQKLQNREKICVLICTIRPTTIKQIQQMCKEKEIECYPIDEVILKLHRKEVM